MMFVTRAMRPYAGRLWRSSLSGLSALTLLAATGQPPVKLLLPDAGTAPTAAWAIDLTQTMQVTVDGGHAMAVERNYSAGFRIEKATRAAEDGVSATVRIDSVRAAMVLHDSRQLIDTRRLVGNSFDIAWGRADGAPRSSGSPTIDFGEMMGGAFPVAMLLDNVFPPMPVSAVGTGDSWERVWPRTMILGVDLTTQKINTRFTLEKLERQDGHDIARIRITTADNSIAGTLHIGVLDGIVRDAEITETGGGTLSLGGGSYPYTQTTNIRVDLAARPATPHVGSSPVPAS
jgi:hypothetical protein